MIKLNKTINKDFENVLFYFKKNNALDTLSEDLKKYVLEQTKDSKKTKVLSLTDLSNKTVKKVHVFCFAEGCVMTSLKKEFPKFVKSNQGKFNLLLDVFAETCKGVDAFAKQMILDINYFNYKFDRFKSKKTPNNNEYLLVSKSDLNEVLNETTILSNAIDNTRDLVNTPVNYLNTYELVDYVTELVKELPNTTLEVLDEKQCEELKMNAFLGVNKGSLQKARMITLKYQGLDNFENPIGLVGKGVMFDTGGYSIKQNMGNMKCDMAGSATVIGIFEAAAKLKLPINLIAMVAATDNRINEHAIVVDDILTAMNGKTIEIGSTDAEGRLTLCDALTYIQTMGCKEIIDMATLTGAVVAALGGYITGVFTNDKEMCNNLIESAKKEDSDFWELPITDHIRSAVRKSTFADLVNRAAPGASAAAAFLEEFIEKDTKWVHVDIAGTAYRTAPSYLEPAGASGVGVKEVINYLKSK